MYQANFERLFRYAFSITKDKQLAENVVSEMFMNIWQKKPDYHNIKDLRAYLHVSVKHLAIRMISKDPQRFCYSAYDETLQVSDAIDPENLLLAKELNELFHESLEALPPQGRQVYEMIRTQGKTADEVARELNISKRTVETHLYQMIKRLKQMLEGHFRDQQNGHLRVSSKFRSLLFFMF